MEDFIKDQWIKEVSIEEENYVEEVALMVVEKLVELNKEHNLDLIELLKNNVQVKIIPADIGVLAADEMVKEEDMYEDVMKMQKQIMDRVLAELQKKQHPEFMN